MLNKSFRRRSIAVSFLVGIINALIPPKKIRKILESKRGKGYLVSAALGSITPFCSCSTIPMLSGLLKARADFGPVLTFLFASPLLNPIVIVLFSGVFGARVTATYAIVSLLFALLNGFLLDKLNFKRFVKQEVYHSAKNAECSTNPCNSTIEDIQPSFNAKGLAKSIWAETYTLFKTVLPYLLIGAAIGAFIHGFVPSDIIASYAGPDNPFAIPVAAAIGIPLYIKASTMVPLMYALHAKGMGLGVLMAMTIGSAGASIPEVILLKSLFKLPMIIAFVFSVLATAIISGYVFTLFA